MTYTINTSLERAVALLGSKAALANACGKKGQHVDNWLRRSNGRLPADNVMAVSRATGWAITPHELRPDIYPNPTDGLPVATPEVA